MNILDLNDDIMSKVKHNIFLRKLMNHREDKFHYEKIDWEKWEAHHDYDFISLNNGDWGCSYSPEFDDETYDLKVEVYKWMPMSKDPNIIDLVDDYFI
eukprot:SAG11_NODE_13760_length_640_cov_35.295749_2_plen_98_part_00